MARTSIAQARINRFARQAHRRNRVAQRAAARTAHRNERHTVASHLHTLGADTATAAAMANSLRKQIPGPGLAGFAPRSLADNRRRRCVRYTRPQIVAALTSYKPRKPAYRDARAQVLAQAA